MSSALKPALPQGAGGQPTQQNSSPKSNAAGQPLGRPADPHLGHHPPNASPAGQNSAHMPQNMAHMPQIMTKPSVHLPGPFSGSSRSAPLSLVQEKPTGQAIAAGKPLALTRTPEKKEGDSVQPHSNGTGDSPKSTTLNSTEPEKSPLRTPTPSESPAKPAAVPTAATPTPEDKPATEDSEAKPSQTPEAPTPPVIVSEPSPLKEPLPLVASEVVSSETSKAPDIPEKSNDVSESNKTEIRATDKPEPETAKSSTLKNLDIKLDTVTDSETPKCSIPGVVPPVVESLKEEPAKVEEVKNEKETEVKTVPALNDVEPKSDDLKTDKAPAETSVPEVASVKPAADAPVSDPLPKAQPSVPNSPAIAPVQKKTEVKPKSTLKLATVTPLLSRKRKKEVKSPLKLAGDGVSPPKKPREKLAPSTGDTPAGKHDTSALPGTPDGRLSKRNRTKVQPYQSPTPELAIVTKMSVNQATPPPSKQNEDRLIVFYKNEFLAVRNAEGGFYVCQTMQNVYRASRKIKIRWLSQDTAADPKGEIYKPDFYDTTDMECVLTTLSLQRAGGAGLRLGAAELSRTESILGRALARDRGETPQQAEGFTEEHPDGLDLSLYKDESQLDKKTKKSPSGALSRKRPLSKSSPVSSKEQNQTDDEADENEDDDDDEEESPKPSPRKRAAPTPKRAKAKPPPKAKTPAKSKTPKAKTPARDSKQSSSNSLPPISATTTNKAATTPAKLVASPKGAAKKATPSKTPAKNGNSTPAAPKGKATPKTTPAKAAAAAKAAQLASTPSTSTGKATRSPRKPPSKK